ncbi:hypothetical protein NDU88_003823 [Pleurodeles waltl]|uniref:Uncharacterized protein n=1 Tax=Pleurodeles waltl TaxID=8319 RepID=A0AAV7NJB0_PLEWA|nr:hypothetical protein NDU88_003823 [Pleurodeles waltl]
MVESCLLASRALWSRVSPGIARDVAGSREWMEASSRQEKEDLWAMAVPEPSSGAEALPPGPVEAVRIPGTELQPL